MSILTASNLGISFGAFDLFRGISVSIPNDGKIGLIGPNGIGKTSLLLLLAGINAPTSGKVHTARGRRLGYLRQEAVDAFADHTSTVYAEMMTVFADLQEQQENLHTLEADMANGNCQPGSTGKIWFPAGGVFHRRRVRLRDAHPANPVRARPGSGNLGHAAQPSFGWSEDTRPFGTHIAGKTGPADA